jgi:hypothetical protein
VLSPRESILVRVPGPGKFYTELSPVEEKYLLGILSSEL